MKIKRRKKEKQQLTESMMGDKTVDTDIEETARKVKAMKTKE